MVLLVFSGLLLCSSWVNLLCVVWLFCLVMCVCGFGCGVVGGGVVGFFSGVIVLIVEWNSVVGFLFLGCDMCIV